MKVSLSHIILLKNEKEQIKSYNKSGTSKGRTNLHKATLRSFVKNQNLPKKWFSYISLHSTYSNP